MLNGTYSFVAPILATIGMISAFGYSLSLRLLRAKQSRQSYKREADPFDWRRKIIAGA